MEEYIDVDLQSLLQERTRQLIASDVNSLLQWLKDYDRIVDEYQEGVRRVVNDNQISELSNEELGKQFQSLRSLQTRIAMYDQFGMYSGQYFEAEANQILEKRKLSPQVRLENCAVLTHPWTHSTLQREELALLRVLNDLVKETDVASKLTEGSPREIRVLLIAKATVQVRKIVDEFGWIPVFLENPTWDEDHFLRQLTNNVMSFRSEYQLVNAEDWRELVESAINRIRLQPERNKSEAIELAAKLQLSDCERKIFEVFRGAVHARNECEYQVGFASMFVKPTVEAICKRLSLTDDHFLSFSTNEVVDLLNGHRTLDDFPLSRHYVCGGWYENGEFFRQMTMAEALDFRVKFDTSEHESLKSERVGGVGVSPGIAEGRVCVVRAFEDLSNFNAGDVLVAVATTTDYVASMRSASGIITEHGGWSCHAAIIAREYGIPAIVGYSGAMKFFKDGERIRFNAATGVAERCAGSQSDQQKIEGSST